MKMLFKVASVALAVYAQGAHAQAPDLKTIPPYKKEFNVVGRLRIAGSELKGIVDLLVEGFKKFHPDAKVSTNFMTSSEGALGMMYAGVSDVAPMGDDAKVTDQMPFFNTFGYMPTEISVATGGSEKRGSLWAWARLDRQTMPVTRATEKMTLPRRRRWAIVGSW